MIELYYVEDDPNIVAQTDDGWMVNAPIIILDDASFLAYCKQIGITPQLNGAIIRNQIRDVTNSDFRHSQYVPYIKGDKRADCRLQGRCLHLRSWQRKCDIGGTGFFTNGY